MSLSMRGGSLHAGRLHDGWLHDGWVRAVGPTLGVVAALLGLATPSSALAQDLSFSTTLDAAGDPLYAAFADVALRLGPSTGLQTVVSLGTYLTRVAGENRAGLAPAVAVRRAGGWGAVQAKLGWGRSSATTVGAGAPPTMMMRSGAALSRVAGTAMAIQAADGDESGWNASLLGEIDGEGPWTLQGVASYSWGGEVLWTRVRATRAVVSRMDGGSVGLGGELVWQRQMDDGDVLRDAEYRATGVGPVLRIARSGGDLWALSGGLKHAAPDAGDTWYAKLELTIDP